MPQRAGILGSQSPEALKEGVFKADFGAVCGEDFLLVGTLGVLQILPNNEGFTPAN